MDTTALTGTHLTIEGRDFTVTSVTERPAADVSPPFTLIEIRAAPRLRIDLALPQEWNDRLYTMGNGGYAGEPFDSPMRDFTRGAALAKEYAVVGTNTGHDCDEDPLGTFASDADKLLDYAHRAIHQSVLVARLLVERIYGSPPRYSYYEGCSTGGRQGLVAALRYPEDFDGIVAGAPVLDFTGSNLWCVKTAQILDGAGIGDSEMRIVADAIARTVSAPDGHPALVEDYRALDFDVRRDVPILADGETGAGALTARQADALAKIYAPATIGPDRVFPGMPPGAEAAGRWEPGTPVASGWAGWFYEAPYGMFAANPGGSRLNMGVAFLRDMAAFDGDWRDFDFAVDALDRIEELSRLVDVRSADLGAFKAKGGKLLMYHGSADAAVNPERTRLYFDDMRTQMGAAEVDAFARFYPAPGVFHCFGGYAPDRFDMLDPLTAWVEGAEAPASIMATTGQPDAFFASEWAQPLFPYPGNPLPAGGGSLLVER